MGRVVDHEEERADLVVRAHDARRTPGEQAALEEAANCDRLAARCRAEGAYKDAQDFEDGARRWRETARREAAARTGSQ